MLILRRKSGESIVIGNNILVTVVDINEGSIRLAIDAPREISILRSELLEAADENRVAAQDGSSRPERLLHILSAADRMGGKARGPFPASKQAPPPAAEAPEASFPGTGAPDGDPGSAAGTEPVSGQE